MILSSVTQVLDKLPWPTLQTRRRMSRLETLHKIFHKQLAISIPSYYLPIGIIIIGIYIDMDIIKGPSLYIFVYIIILYIVH